tara:strand:+ start:41 stop:250 length:210 start_codon:yes stop_codon:yes gene_type:complete
MRAHITKPLTGQKNKKQKNKKQKNKKQKNKNTKKIFLCELEIHYKIDFLRKIFIPNEHRYENCITPTTN